MRLSCHSQAHAHRNRKHLRTAAGSDQRRRRHSRRQRSRPQTGPAARLKRDAIVNHSHDARAPARWSAGQRAAPRLGAAVPTRQPPVPKPSHDVTDDSFSKILCPIITCANEWASSPSSSTRRPSDQNALIVAPVTFATSHTVHPDKARSPSAALAARSPHGSTRATKRILQQQLVPPRPAASRIPPSSRSAARSIAPALQVSDGTRIETGLRSTTTTGKLRAMVADTTGNRTRITTPRRRRRRPVQRQHDDDRRRRTALRILLPTTDVTRDHNYHRCRQEDGRPQIAARRRRKADIDAAADATRTTIDAAVGLPTSSRDH